MARQIEESSETPILNPRNLQAASLLDVDMDWLRDLGRWRDWVRYMEDLEKRPADLH